MNEYMRKRMEDILAGRPLKSKEKKPIAKISEKLKKKREEAKQIGTDTEMDKFFTSQRKHMKDKCLFCGSSTMKKDDDKFHFSIAHLLPKSIFKSVATNPDNWVELCFWNNSCHTNFDNGKITWEFIKDSKEWDIIKEKLLNILPSVAEEEKKHKLYDRLVKLVYNA